LWPGRPSSLLQRCAASVSAFPAHLCKQLGSGKRALQRRDRALACKNGVAVGRAKLQLITGHGSRARRLPSCPSGCACSLRVCHTMRGKHLCYDNFFHKARCSSASTSPPTMTARQAAAASSPGPDARTTSRSKACCAWRSCKTGHGPRGTPMLLRRTPDDHAQSRSIP
jgi:hypothetical protein